LTQTTTMGRSKNYVNRRIGGNHVTNVQKHHFKTSVKPKLKQSGIPFKSKEIAEKRLILKEQLIALDAKKLSQANAFIKFLKRVNRNTKRLKLTINKRPNLNFNSIYIFNDISKNLVGVRDINTNILSLDHFNYVTAESGIKLKVVPVYVIELYKRATKVYVDIEMTICFTVITDDTIHSHLDSALYELYLMPKYNELLKEYTHEVQMDQIKNVYNAIRERTEFQL
jgi:hypothetical protein